jgi:hypothetical protein
MTRSYMLSMRTDGRPVFGFPQPTNGFHVELPYKRMKGEKKTPKAPGLTRQVIARNVLRLLDYHYAHLPSITQRQRALARDAGVGFGTVQRMAKGRPCIGPTGGKMATADAKKVSKLAAPAEDQALAKGEIYRGVTLHEGKLAHLIELPGEFTGTHAEATKWAKEQGGELPSRIDGIVLFEAAKKGEYQRDWYWLAPQRAGDAGFAWVQHFGYGDQTGATSATGIAPARSAERPFSNSSIPPCPLNEKC